MELRQNWYKFQKILGPLPPKKPGVLVLQANNRVLAGALGLPAGSPSSAGFGEVGRQIEHIDNTWEELSHKYGAAGASFIDQVELQKLLSQVAAVRSSSPATDHFHAQLVRLREALGVERGEKSRLAVHMGERPVESFWPRKNFLLGLFRSFFGELFPEKKLLLIGVVNDPQNFDALLLEFQGAELKGFCEPDFSGIDWKGFDLFLPDTASRFVAWCENHYMLPAYSLFLSRRVWEECRDAQAVQGDKPAWKALLKSRSQRDVEKEVLFEPEPWPMKALLRWHSFRG
jgi:hypothetical protein